MHVYYLGIFDMGYYFVTFMKVRLEDTLLKSSFIDCQSHDK